MKLEKIKLKQTCANCRKSRAKTLKEELNMEKRLKSGDENGKKTCCEGGGACCMKYDEEYIEKTKI